MSENSAEFGAKWWADKVRGGSRFDNGDESQMGTTVSALAVLLQSRAPAAGDGAVMEFERLLRETIQKDLTERGCCWLDVDYNPCRPLAEALTAAGIQKMLPWKTSMRVWPTGVEVREGYGAEPRVIWGSP